MLSIKNFPTRISQMKLWKYNKSHSNWFNNEYERTKKTYNENDASTFVAVYQFRITLNYLLGSLHTEIGCKQKFVASLNLEMLDMFSTVGVNYVDIRSHKFFFTDECKFLSPK